MTALAGAGSPPRGPCGARAGALTNACTHGVTAVTVQVPADGSDTLVIECQTDARDDVEAMIARAVANRWSLHQLQRQQPTLENIFLRYVADSPADGRAAA